jgi:hypothetical protein
MGAALRSVEFIPRVFHYYQKSVRNFAHRRHALCPKEHKRVRPPVKEKRTKSIHRNYFLG